MKKVLLVFDGTNFSEGAFEFVRRLNEISGILLTGVFMPQVAYANLWSYSAATGGGGVFIPMLEDDETELVTRNMEHFESLCHKNGIRYRLHKDFFDFALPELKKESRFADVIVLGGEMFYKGVTGGSQFDFIRDALRTTECPVMIVPERFEFPDNNILAYDGSEESVYAIKQFAYVFPELAKNKTLLVYADDETDKKFPSQDYITELATQHYNDLIVYKLEIEPKKYFHVRISERKGSLLVSGSYSRSAFSQAFRKSFVNDIIKEHVLPVFIAHK